MKIDALGDGEVAHVLWIEVHRLEPCWILTDRHIGFFHRPRYENEITNTVNVDELASPIVNQSIAEESLFSKA